MTMEINDGRLPMAERFRAYRKAHNLTQAQMAERLGCSQVFVTEVETLKKLPGPDLLSEIQRKSLAIPLYACDWEGGVWRARLLETLAVDDEVPGEMAARRYRAILEYVIALKHAEEK